jgi:c-di-GMP-binding flagellar brake protein YcgR
MTDKNAKLLREAIARNVMAVLSLPSAAMLRNYKSRLLGELDGGILLQSTLEARPLSEDLIRSKTPVVVSFRNETMRVVFASPILRIQPRFKINDELLVEAVLLAFPTKIQSQQKRFNYRVEIPPYTEISVRVWRMGPGDHLKTPPLAATELKTEIRNLSTGGVGVKLLGADGEPPKVCTDDRLRVELRFNNNALLIEGKMRKPSNSSKDWLITGIEFEKLEQDFEGRQTLSQLVRIVGELQRTELRNVRMGLTKTA